MNQTAIIVVDLEATCWGPGDPDAGSNEIIEIGAVRVDPQTLDPIDDFQSLVRPVRYPVLSEFCVGLLSITQAEVDGADPFPAVWPRFLKWCERPETVTIACWGANDVPMLLRDCEYHRLEYPFNTEYINLKKRFAERHEGKKVGMKRALQMLDIPLKGTHHRALADARNICRILQKLRLNGEPA